MNARSSVAEAHADVQPVQIIVVQHWFDELTRFVPRN